MKKNVSSVLTAIELILALVLAIGAQTLFCACSADEDGSYMRCHWAQMAVVACGVVLAVQYLMTLLMKNARMKAGLLLATLPVCVAVALFPGTIIGLCMMNTMHCWMMLRPAAIAFGVVLFVLSLVQGVLLCKGEQDEK